MELQLTISAAAVAWYAAIVATLSLGVSLFVALRDRPRITVVGRPGYKVTSPAGGYNPNKLYIMVNVANRGRRPVTVEKAFLQMKSKPHAILTDSLLRGPQELREGRSVTFLVEQEGIDFANVKAVVAIDQTGRHWKGSLRREKG